MKFGMPTLIEYRDIGEHVSAAHARGLDFIEINLSFPKYHSHTLPADALNGYRAQDGVFFTFHVDEQLNPVDFDERVSAAYFRVMRDDIRLALAVRAPVINMHLQTGVYVTLTGGKVYLTDVYRDEYLSRVRAFIAMCEEEIGAAPLRICIENTDNCPFTAAERAAIELFMASPVFALTMDTGHECCLGRQNMDIYRTYAERRIHMHLHDSDGRRAHLALGDGILPVGELLREPPPPPETCLIEVKTVEGLDRSIAYLKQNNLWKEAEI